MNSRMMTPSPNLNLLTIPKKLDLDVLRSIGDDNTDLDEMFSNFAPEEKKGSNSN